MKYIERYKELGFDVSESLKDNISKTPISEKERILQFLKTGTYNGVRCSSIYDYVKNEPTFKDINLYTDGIYEWDDEEIYHFEHYNIKLDDDFIEHVLNT